MFKKCPNNTYQVSYNPYICFDEIPENFYLDSNDGIYKECYKSCKKCFWGGDEKNNNCSECKGSCADCRRCGECGRFAYPKHNPVPMDQNPLNFIPGLNLISLPIHLAVVESRRGYVCSGCREDCRDCTCN